MSSQLYMPLLFSLRHTSFSRFFPKRRTSPQKDFWPSGQRPSVLQQASNGGEFFRRLQIRTVFYMFAKHEHWLGKEALCPILHTFMQTMVHCSFTSSGFNGQMSFGELERHYYLNYDETLTDKPHSREWNRAISDVILLIGALFLR